MTISFKDDGSYISFKNDGKYWYDSLNNFHRLDGPAIEYNDGGYIWCQDGKVHRLDGPAYENKFGHKEWLKDDLLHREDGPAVERVDGTKEYWIEGNRITDQIEINKINSKNIIRTEFVGRIEYTLNGGPRHRLDGPALIRGADEFYYVNGKKIAEVINNVFRTVGLKQNFEIFVGKKPSNVRINSETDFEFNFNGATFAVTGGICSRITNFILIDKIHYIKSTSTPEIKLELKTEANIVENIIEKNSCELTEFSSAAYRVAVNQIIKTIPHTSLKALYNFPAGREMINYLLGHLFGRANNQQIQALGEEFRIEAIAGAGEKVLNAFISEVVTELEEAEENEEKISHNFA